MTATTYATSRDPASASEPATSRPLLGLAVDGVLALSETPSVEVVRERVTADGRWAREINVPADAATKIAELGAFFDIVWITAWGHTAHTCLQRVLDLPSAPWPYLPVQFDKARALARHAEGRPWALIHDGSDTYPYQDADGVQVVVDADRGLTDVDCPVLIDTIRQLHTAPRGATEENMS